MKAETQEKLKALVEDFAIALGAMEEDAQNADALGVRKKGGVLRAAKGKIHEVLTEELVRIAWETELSNNAGRLAINKKKIPIFLKDTENHAKKFSCEPIQKYILAGDKVFTHKLSVDKHIEVDGKLIFAIECKAYAENKMMKGILTDFYLLKTKVPDLLCYLFQLENFLGGDFGKTTKNPLGSPATHALLSHFPEVNLKIITLLDGNRDVHKPIHEPKFFKPLTIDRLEVAVESIIDGFRECKAA